MEMNQHRIKRRDPRCQGSVYILVLGASLLVALIGVSSLMASRVQRRSVSASADTSHARELARTGVERGLWLAKSNPTSWRQGLSLAVYTDVAFGQGTFTVTGTDLVDGDMLNNTVDPVLVISTGKSGEAIYKLQVTLNGDGTVQPGTWKRLVGSEADAVAAAATAAVN